MSKYLAAVPAIFPLNVSAARPALPHLSRRRTPPVDMRARMPRAFSLHLHRSLPAAAKRHAFCAWRAACWQRPGAPADPGRFSSAPRHVYGCSS